MKHFVAVRALVENLGLPRFLAFETKFVFLNNIILICVRTQRRREQFG